MQPKHAAFHFFAETAQFSQCLGYGLNIAMDQNRLGKVVKETG